MGAHGTGFASDLDGTLCTSDWTTREEFYRDEDLAAVRAYQEAGGRFGICTGRPLESVLQSLEGRLELDFYIVTTGSLVLDGSRRCLWRRTVGRDVAQELFERYGSPHATIAVVSEEDFVAVGDDGGMGIPTVPSLASLGGEILDVSVECQGDQARARAICDDINRRFAGVVEGFQNLSSVDVVAAGCSKGSGVRVVREALGLSAVAGAGDSFNDLPLLEAADVSYTFVSSPAEVRAAADVVVDHLASAVRDFAAR